MRLSSKHSAAQRIAAAPDDPTALLDCYETPAVAVEALVRVERGHMPHTLWEPAAGPGAIVRALRNAGHICHASDVYDYGQLPGLKVEDYLAETTVPPIGVAGIVTNPPFFAAQQFVEKAIRQVPYSAFLLLIQWLESTRRLPFFRATPPARVWISSRRLPMMHRYGWTGPKTASNVCYAWFVFDAASAQKGQLGWFDWQETAPEQWVAA